MSKIRPKRGVLHVGVLPATAGRTVARASVARNPTRGGDRAHPLPPGSPAGRTPAPAPSEGGTATTDLNPTTELPATRPHRRALAHGGRSALRRAPITLALGLLLLVIFAAPAFAQSTGGGPSLSGVIDNLRNWLVGILAGVATLFLTIGGLRYLTAGGDPGQVEKAKVALKSAAIGYALAILAPLLVSILASIVGG